MPTFRKSERLCSKIILQKIFQSDAVNYLYPFRLHYLTHHEPVDVLPQVVISVSRRNFKKATDRNLLKRRMREVYRLHKHLLLDEQKNCKIAYLAIIYIAKEKLSFQEMEKKILRLFQRFTQ